MHAGFSFIMGIVCGAVIGLVIGVSWINASVGGDLKEVRQGAIEAGVGRWQAEISKDGKVRRYWQWRSEDGWVEEGEGRHDEAQRGGNDL